MERFHRAGPRPAHLLVSAALARVLVASPALHAQTNEPAPVACEVRGHVASTGRPLPGVALSAQAAGATGAGATASGLDGAFVLRLPGPGHYELKASLPGFVDGTRSLELEAGACRATADIDMPLASRAPQAAAAAPEATPAPTPARPAARTAAGAGRGRGGDAAERFRNMVLSADAAAQGQPEGADAASQALLPPGATPDAPTESVTLAGSGNAAQTVDALLYGDRQAWLDDAGGDLEALARRVAQAGIDTPFGGGFGPGGPGGGFGPGGPGGPGGFGGRGGFGGFNRSQRLQGSVFYHLAGAPFDASPYSLNGQPTVKPDYFQHRYGATLGGPLKMPGSTGPARTSFFLNYSGNHTRRPYDAYSTVPTAAERAGEFADGDLLYDPLTGEPFPGT